MKNLYHRLLLVIAGATQKELAQYVRYLKIENQVLRSKLPRRVPVTEKDRAKLVKFGSKLGGALDKLVTIVHPDTLRRWIRESKDPKKKSTETPAKKDRPRTAEEIRELIVKLGRENAWGYTRILGELPTRADNISVQLWRDNVSTALKEHIDRTPFVNPAQRASAYVGADAIADAYVSVVQRRAQSHFDIENSDAVFFGNNGNASGWVGNRLGGAQCNCDNWANLVKNELEPLSLSNSGWKANAHWDALKAGDVSLSLGGWGTTHNYISLTFDPNDRGL